MLAVFYLADPVSCGRAKDGAVFVEVYPVEYVAYDDGSCVFEDRCDLWVVADAVPYEGHVGRFVFFHEVEIGFEPGAGAFVFG